ncbi:MAG: A24 family peptidase [Polyangiaceae bacterium]
MLPFFVAAVILAAVAAWTDWRTGEIPNWLTFGTMVLAPIAHVVVAITITHLPVRAAFIEGAYSVGGLLLCGMIPLLLYTRGGIGGGDVKLFAAIGALCMSMFGVEAEMYGFFVAALIAPARLAYEGKLLRTIKNAAFLMVNPFLPAARKLEVQQEMMTWFRMGPAIFLGVLAMAITEWRSIR